MSLLVTGCLHAGEGPVMANEVAEALEAFCVVCCNIISLVTIYLTFTQGPTSQQESDHPSSK